MAKFTAVEFPREYPLTEVAEHEILMAFNRDADALAFREWWSEQGADAFGEWLERPDEPVCPHCGGDGWITRTGGLEETEYDDPCPECNPDGVAK